ncbi:hybrid sensor histidine kinase/response regulator [Desulfogranum japonicum]|uniref:hybrid sensor histidine kinase/response regulator n=1 Tax=Desulfogranum japonicum TaxID=231447 RepID=UPI000423F253|nr:PAS domain-containing sensor histidine kinase [Desulfogranum japonicum]
MQYEQMLLDSALGTSLITTDTEGLITGFSRGAELMLGYCASELVGRATPLLFHDKDEVLQRNKKLEQNIDIPGQGFKVFAEQVEAGQVNEQEWTYKRKDGSRLIVSLTLSQLRDDSGKHHGYLGVAVDITERKLMEQALVQEKHFFDQLIKSLPGIFYLYDSNLHLRRWNKNHETLLGYTGKEIEGKYLGAWHANKEERSLAVTASKGIIEEGIEIDAVESTLLHKNGKEIPFLLTGVRVDSPDGPMLAGVGIDLTEHKQLEEQLFQSQKMESIGLLAGGIAHDFNNILTAIIGNIDLAKKIAGQATPLAKYIDNTKRAAESAAQLTRQLLAFSRKEVIAPRPLDLNIVFDELEGMLNRLLGEDITLRIEKQPNLWMVLIDPGQFDQIILNLAVNARDAMINGGNLVMETRNCIIDKVSAVAHPDLAPGEYVTLTVSDDGVGMTKETVSHVFEPFFTTKAMGRGTGLGLATVFGAVKQNHGYITLSSEPGKGTTFMMYFPRVDETTPVGVPLTTRKKSHGTGESIILAEDDEGIRTVSTEILTDLGYRVIACADGESALDASIASGSVDLLVTDLIMQGMNGKELAARMQAIHKNMKILFFSGYTADILGRHGMLDPDIHFLAKPFTLDQLTRKVREVLDC